MKIRVLDGKVVSRIAAGEVVERPASVVKELVENALDAGATVVSVEAKGGGLELLRVTDDGRGIPAAEAELAFERHATSKINRLEDLESIDTLGFRGEALPSIAAVAAVELSTLAAGERSGSSLRLDGGRVVEHRSEGRSGGTSITVSGLFRDIPARRKFLKSNATENGHIAAVVSRYALAFPPVRFTLVIDGKTTLRTAGRGSLMESVIEVYGIDTARDMLAVDDSEGWGEAGMVKVTGLVGAPSLSRSGRGYLNFFVNRRWVNSRLLAWAVEEAYHGLIMAGRHPVAVLNIAITPQEVDINIHPAKSEVKFRDERAVFTAVQKAVRRTLVSGMPVPSIQEAAATYSPPTVLPREAIKPVAAQPSLPLHADRAQPLAGTLPVLRVLGQVLSSYIVAEGPDGVYLIDQHAAHERVLYEQLCRKGSKPEAQGLLEPVPLGVTPRQEEALRASASLLAEFGFSLEPFGERTYLVRTVPAMLHGNDWAGALREALDSLSGEGYGRMDARLTETIACHAAVRAGQSMSDGEMRALVREMELLENPQTCPHGRPTVIRLGREKLEREFGRG